MTKQSKTDLIASSGRKSNRSRLRKKIGEIDSYKFSAVDLAIFGAAFALLVDRASHASNDKVFREVLENNKKPNLDFEHEDFLIQVGGSTAEALTFSGLLSNLRNDIVRKTDQSFAEKYIIKQLPSEDIISPETLLDEEFALDDILGLEGGLVTQIAVDPSGEKSNPSNQGSYTEEMHKMQSASDQFLEVMKELFATELETLIAKNEGQEKNDTVNQEEVTQIAEIDAESGGGGSYGLLGLLGLGGGGGGGGGLLSALGSGGAGRLFSGFGIDGYVSGATVFWDIDGDFIQDANETIQTTTDSSGFYSLSGVTAGIGQIVIKNDGVDTNTGGSVGMMAAATDVTDSANAHVTPLTLLKAQGVAESTLLDAIGVTVDIDSFNPMDVLETSTDDTELATAGTVLLKAQQLFSVVNSVAGLAEESGLSAAEALTSTVNAIGQRDLANLVGENGGDETTLAAIITQVAPDFESVAAAAAASLKNVNQVLGESLADPKNALGEDARAAALITQDDLVTSFKQIGRLDPQMAASEISSKLGSFANVADIKANFQDIYKATIQAAADSEGGIIAGLDNITVKSGSGQLVSVSDILGNDVNNGTGELRLVGIEPSGLSYSVVSANSQLVAREQDTNNRPDLNNSDTKLVYTLQIPNDLSIDGYVKVKLGPFTILERVGANDTSEIIADRIVQTINNSQDAENPSIIIQNSGSSISVERINGEELRASVSVAQDNAAIDAKIIYDDDGNQFVSIDTSVAVSTNLRYIVANDTGQGHGNIRLTVEPDFRTVQLNPGRPQSIDEDGILSLKDQVTFDGISSSNVSEKLFLTLNSVEGTTGDFLVNLGGVNKIIEVGRPQEIRLSELNTAQLLQPQNFHGTFDISFDLIGSFEAFSSRSSSEVSALTVNPVAESADEQSIAKLILGEIESDLEGSIIPVVSGEPTEFQITKLKLEGGDSSETHSIEFFGIPNGLSILVNGVEKTALFGRVVVEEAEIGKELSIQFKASEALIDSSFGLFEGVSAIVVGQDGSDKAAGSEINLSLDIGGAYGLNVASQAITVSDEDISAALGGLDITSIESGATIEARITLTEPTATTDNQLPKIGTLINGVFVALDAENVTINTGIQADTGHRFITYTIISNDPLNVLDPLKVLHPVSHFKGQVTANAEIIAKVANQDGSSQEIASVTKGPMIIEFEPVADTVTFDLPNTSVSTDEDSGISIKPLFFNNDISRAASADSSEEIIYVVSGLPAGTRLIDGEALKDINGNNLSGGELKVAIPLAPTIGTIVGNKIELSSVEASRAQIVTLSDKHLDNNSIQVAAFSRELGTSKTSELAGNHSVNIAINAVADSPYLSVDSRVRGLVDDNLSAELQSKSVVKIPASAALVDTDGSEALWVRITPQNADISNFSFSGTDFLSSADSSYILLKASDLASLQVTMPAGNGGYNDNFKIEAISVESSDITGTSFTEISSQVNNIITSNETKLFAITSADIEVEFLQPAKSPTLNLSTISYGSESLSEVLTQYYAEFQLSITDKQATDVVTILATGVPSVAGTQTKFYRYLSDTGQYEDIGAPAEVSGVWVFSYNDVINENTGNPYDLRIGLPATYSHSAGDSDMEFTAFSVDSLGLTNAKSSAVSKSIDLEGASFGTAVPADAADPIVIDIQGDGLEFVSQEPGVSFDINSDGVIDNIGWLTGDDDAFLVLLPEESNNLPSLIDNGALNGSNLITEYLVSPTTTDALSDLIAVDANSDGNLILTKSELVNSQIIEPSTGKVPYLWFDDGDGLASYSELAYLSEDFSIDLSAFNDNTIVTSSGTVIAASQLDAGSISGSYTLLLEDGSSSEIQNSLNSSLAADIFLPISPPSSQKQAESLPELLLSDQSIYFEDADDGFDIGSILQDTEQNSWQGAFGESAWTAISQGAKVLLTIQAKNVGTYFNLSEGARLEAEPKDTWLTLWDPLARSIDKPSGKEKFDIFLRDNFSGELELEVRATVVYSEGLQPKEVTIQRDLSLDIAAVADRPDFLVPQTSSETDESETNLSVPLDGIELSANDLGEIPNLVIQPNDDNPSELISLLYKGSEVLKNADGNFEISGEIQTGDLVAIAPAYSSGTYGFKLSAFSTDGDVVHLNDANPIEDIPFNFTINPTAQSPVVSTLIGSNIIQNGVSETSPVFEALFQSELVDKDGSEEISAMTIYIAGSISSPLQDAPTFVSSQGIEFPLSEEINSGQNKVGLYKVVIPKSLLEFDAEASIYSIRASITTPDYFDGEITVYSEATSVEKLDTSKRADAESESVNITITPVADGFTEEGFLTSGVTTQAGDLIEISSIVKRLDTLDQDEVVNLRFFDLPEGTKFYAPNGNEILANNGELLLNQIGLADLNGYGFKTSTDQGNFVFSVGASTEDDLQVSSEQIRTVNIASSALFEPIFVNSEGDILNDPISFEALEGGSGFLDLSVALGDQLNPRDAVVNISGIPSGFIVRTPSGELAQESGGGFELSANKLSQGLVIEAGSLATLEEKNTVGIQNLNVSAQVNYTVDGANLSKTANISALMTIQPVTDGVIFTNSKDIDEDTTFLLLDSGDPNNSLFQKIDASEQLVQIIIEQNENFQILLPNSSEFISLGNNITLAGEDLNNLSQVSIKPIANFNGLTNLSISVQTVGVSNNEDNALSGDLITQQAIIPITINAVADDLVIGTDGALLSEQVSNTQMFELFDSQTGNLLNEPIINDGRVDLETNLEIKLEIKDFSSLDSSEQVFAKISGDAITENTQIITGSGIGQVVFDSQEVTGVPGTYEILIPGNGPGFAALEAENTSLIIPKVESGYGSKNVLLELIGTDGDATNIATTEVKSISILSTIPPEPLTGLSNDIQASELSEDFLRVDGIKLNDLVRVPNLNESHIIQLIDLPEGVEIHVGENIISEDNLRTHPQQEKMTSVQLTSEQFLNSFVKVPDDIIDGKNNLDFQVRVGTSDGNTSNGADTRFVFSRLVELNLNFGNQSTLNNDVVISEQESLNLGHGDDIAILSSKIGGSLSGGEGRDSISFNEFDDSQSVFIDMNMNKFLVTDNSENIESTNLIRQLDNFENIVGGKGDDTIVGSELNTTSLVLRGNEGDDHLVGGAGDDIIEGGEGVDLLAGSLGLNTFIINTNEGQDTILDFKSGDKLLFAGFNITHQSDGSLPPELKIKSSEGTNQDWIVEVTKITSEGTLVSSVVLSGLQNNYVSIEDVQNLLTSSIEFNDTLDLGSIDPEQSEFAFEFDALSIISDLHERNNFFGETLNFSSATNSDDISDALGVIADSKYQEALIFTDAVSSKNLIDGFGDALNLEYKGLSGSEGNDVLVALDKDSVLYGGDGGSDRLIGGIGDDILISKGEAYEEIDELSGGAGIDLFTMINPKEIEENLDSIYRQVKIEDFNREEGDRVLLVGYENSDIELSDVNNETNLQTAIITNDNSDSLTIYFDLSFAREFDTNFALRMADFDKVEAS